MVFFLKEPKRNMKERRRKCDAEARFLIFLEREGVTSL